jgi:hypothetical protein
MLSFTSSVVSAITLTRHTEETGTIWQMFLLTFEHLGLQCPILIFENTISGK